MAANAAIHPWTRTADGVRLTVRLTPRAGRDGFGGVRTDAEGVPHLVARVTAPPVDGAANNALIKLVAQSVRVPKSAVTLISGAGARIKILEIAGDPGTIESRLSALTS